MKTVGLSHLLLSACAVIQAEMDSGEKNQYSREAHSIVYKMQQSVRACASHLQFEKSIGATNGYLRRVLRKYPWFIFDQRNSQSKSAVVRWTNPSEVERHSMQHRGYTKRRVLTEN